MRIYKLRHVTIHFQKVLVGRAGLSIHEEGISMPGPEHGGEVLAVGTECRELVGAVAVHDFLAVDDNDVAAGAVRFRVTVYQSRAVRAKEDWGEINPRPGSGGEGNQRGNALALAIHNHLAN